VRRLAAIAVLAAALAACGDAKTTGARATRAAFTLELPKGWVLINARNVRSRPPQPFERLNPRLGERVEALALSLTPVKLVAFDPASGRARRTYVDVVATQLPEAVSFERFRHIELSQLRRLPKVRDLRDEVTQAAARRALHLTFNVGRGLVLDQYFIKRGRGLYVITYTTPRRTFARYEQAFAESARTFRLR
jgi:hypothetical protein